MPVSLTLTSGGAGIAVERLAEVLTVFVAHHRELEIDRFDAVELGSCLGHAASDFVLQWTPWDGEGDQHADDAVVHNRHAAQHAEFDDRAVQLGVLDRAKCLDDLVFRDDGGAHGVQCGDAPRDLHYGRR